MRSTARDAAPAPFAGLIKMSRILRLFAIRKTSEEQHIEGIYFSDMEIARKARDAYVTQTNEPHVVTWGPDHKKFKEIT